MRGAEDVWIWGGELKTHGYGGFRHMEKTWM